MSQDDRSGVSRELLKECQMALFDVRGKISDKNHDFIPNIIEPLIEKLICELAKPESFNPSWVNYRQGKEDGKLELLEDQKESKL